MITRSPQQCFVTPYSCLRGGRLGFGANTAGGLWRCLAGCAATPRAGPDAGRSGPAAAVGPGTVWFVGNTFTAAGNEGLPYALGTSNG
jgi:hypothetical protein